MKYILVATMILLALMATPVLADDGDKTPDRSSATMTGHSLARAQVGSNPWGCMAKSHYPHESTDTPGQGWINAKSDIECTVAPGAHNWEMIQILRRSSYYGWVQIAVTYSQCPSGIGDPDCSATMMRAYTHWQCFSGTTTYDYKLSTPHEMQVGDDTYTAYTTVTARDVTCTNNG